MSAPDMLAPGAMAVALLLMALHLGSVALVLARRWRRPAPEGILGQPAVTLLRPVCGLDPFDAVTLATSFRQDWPDYEVIFCAARPDDPAVALVNALIAAHPDVPARLLIGDAPAPGQPRLRNPKLRNVLKGWQAARSDWICMADSNLLLPPDYLASVVASWGPGTGLVSGPPIGVQPRGWAAHLECAFLNANQARLQLAADALGQGFAQGKTLFFNRPLIEGAGGLRALDRNLAEDVNATRLVRALGLRVSLTPHLFAQPIGARSLRQVWDRQARWARVRREGFPALFALEPLNGAAVPVLLLALSGAPWLAVAGFAALWFGAEGLLARVQGWPLGWRGVLLGPLRDALGPALWLAALVRGDVVWRGNALAGASPQRAASDCAAQ